MKERRTAQEFVYEVLRDAILSGKLRGGARLIQDKIATELQVSRVPVREALLQLAAEGLARMEAHRGASVVYLSPADIAEMFEIRALLVRHAIRLVVPLLKEEDLVRLEAIALKQQREASMAVRNKLNSLFYTVLLEPLDRPRLKAMLDKIEREVERYLLPLERPHLGHAELVAACRAHDAVRASELVANHLEAVGQRASGRVQGLIDSGELPRSTEKARPRRLRQPVQAAAADGATKVRRGRPFPL